MTRKVTRITYTPYNNTAEFYHSDNTKTFYNPKVCSRVRLEFLPYKFLTTFSESFGKATIYIRHDTIKTEWKAL
jgi:hypothetical protein